MSRLWLLHILRETLIRIVYVTEIGELGSCPPRDFNHSTLRARAPGRFGSRRPRLNHVFWFIWIHAVPVQTVNN